MEVQVLWVVIALLVAVVGALVYRTQQQAVRIGQLRRHARQLEEQLRTTEQQLKIKEKLYEGAPRHTRIFFHFPFCIFSIIIFILFSLV